MIDRNSELGGGGWIERHQEAVWGPLLDEQQDADRDSEHPPREPSDLNKKMAEERKLIKREDITMSRFQFTIILLYLSLILGGVGGLVFAKLAEHG